MVASVLLLLWLLLMPLLLAAFRAESEAAEVRQFLIWSWNWRRSILSLSLLLQLLLLGVELAKWLEPLSWFASSFWMSLVWLVPSSSDDLNLLNAFMLLLLLSFGRCACSNLLPCWPPLLLLPIARSLLGGGEELARIEFGAGCCWCCCWWLVNAVAA